LLSYRTAGATLLRNECATNVARWRKVGIALTEQRPDQALKLLCQRRVANIAFVVIEFAGSEQASSGVGLPT